jgi:outer membrane receptor protein involved in Fe transport
MQYEHLSGSRQDFYNNDLRDLDLGINDVSKANSSDKNSWGLRSFFGRLNYDYNERYLVEMNIRRDGSSRFYGDNQYSYFPSFSLGWKIAKETFWQPLASKISDFTFRASWGQTGNQAVSLYSFYPSLSQRAYSFNNKEVTGFRLTTDPNQNLKWETTEQINFGTDLKFYDGRMALTFDYYVKTTRGILLQLPIPGIIGLQSNYQNAGSVEN